MLDVVDPDLEWSCGEGGDRRNWGVFVMFGALRVACGRWVLAGVAMAAMAAGPRPAWASNIAISDGNFDNWSFASYVSGSGHPKATMSVDKSGGNPAPELVNIHTSKLSCLWRL